ncbi:MAG: tripartite tricarboxylate transporter substrate binding protein [Rhodospirillales bacterium]|nr:tripartite tricarboxylate transporter substrate binding protein [Rhodospirillales bacterium]
MLKSKTQKFAGAVALGAVFLVAGAEMARAEYPDKPIKIIVPFRAGGVTDTLSKLVAKDLAKALGVSVVTQSIGGGGGAVGTAQASRARPNGYTLVMGSDGTLGSTTQANDTGYTHKSFIPIGKIANLPMGMAGRNDAPYKSVKELVAFLKEHPGTKYTTVGTGSSVHLAGAIFAKNNGLKLIHIGNRGGQGAITKLLSKEVEFIMFGASRIPGQVKDGIGKGDYTPIGVTSDGPWSYAPSVPSLKQQGFNLVAYSWWGLYAPLKTPKAAVDKLVVALKTVATSPSFIATLNKFSFTPDYKGPKGATEDLKESVKMYTVGLKEVGLLKRPLKP